MFWYGVDVGVVVFVNFVFVVYVVECYLYEFVVEVVGNVFV